MRFFLGFVILVMVIGFGGIVNAQENGKPDVWLGILAENIDEKQATIMDVSKDSGVLVAFTMPFGPADKQGVLIADIIAEIGGVEVESLSDLKNLLSKYTAGDKANIKLLREGDEVEIEFEFPLRNNTAAEGMKPTSGEAKVF
ncbi:MAG: PDZ domain-containing protein [Candidatus Omnitrophica bacterium]|nr:PDZ domain-containing protein [Candidatus Omnitrophota bacterium]MCF7878179.1 PDZ domain-containing protein [Candidatus Omnitrophota bacterium]